jgi:hypothetical protein
MIRAVYDCNVIMSGIGWNGAARNCLKLVVCRQVFLYVTEEILAEYETVIPETLAEETPKIVRCPSWHGLETKPGWSNRHRWASGAVVMLKMTFTSRRQLQPSR